MAQPKPTTAYYLRYGVATPANTAETLTPVFIGPRYAVHNATYSNSIVSGATIVSGTTTTINEWPNYTSGAIVDSATAKVYVTSPTIELGNSDGASLNYEVPEGGNAIVFSGAVIAGGSTIFQDNYSLRRGDQLVVDDSAYDVISVGQSVGEAGATVKNSAFTELPSWSASYTGDSAATYVITALANGSGGALSALVAAAVGDLAYAPTQMVLSGGVANNIGTLGATVSPASSSLTNATSGAIYFLECSAAAAPAYNVAYLNSSVTSGAVVSYVRTSNALPVESAVIRGGDWSPNTSGGILINSAVDCVVDGRLYPVISGGVAVEYRELLTDSVNELVDGNTTSLDWVGAQVPENPIGEAYKAAIKTGYTGFYMMATAGNTDADYAAALAAAGKVEDVYSLVPLTQNATIIAAAKGVMDQYSAPTVAQPKRVWVYSQLQQNSTILPNAEFASVLGTVSGTSVTNITAGALAGAGVVKGDTLVIKNAYNATTQTYSDVSVKIAAVEGNALTLATDPGVGGPYVLVVKRMLTHTQLAEAIAAEARSYNNVRINYVYAEPNTVAGDYFENAQYIVPVLATLRNELAPHAPLTDVVIPGVSIGTGIGFSEADLDLMNAAGVWICYRDGRGEMVTRHAITTRSDGTIAEEDSAVSNGDNILRTIRNSISWLRGNCNVTPALIDQIYANVAHALDRIQSRVYDSLIGPQILNVESIDVYQDPNNSAGVIGTFNLDLPSPYLDGNFTVNLF